MLDQEKIDLYLLNKLTTKERQAFEDQLAIDESLAKEVQLQRAAFDLLDSLGDQKTRNQLDKIHNKVVGNKKTISSKLILTVILISIISLSGIAYFYFNSKPEEISPKEMYALYYDTYPISLASRSDGSGLKIQQVNALYKQQQFQETLELLDSLINYNDDTTLRLVAGISALQVDSFDKAFEHFNFLINRNDPLYFSQANWYAAMTALKTENTSLAKKHLQALLDSNDNFKKSESQKILDSLK